MREQILAAARDLVESRGYDGFSYADISDIVGIRKPSVHHHFPTKGDLGRALVEEFRAGCRAETARIERDGGRPVDRLMGYAKGFEEKLADGGRMCLCGMLAAGKKGLPVEVSRELDEAIGEQEAWLAGVIADGQESGAIRDDEPARRLAQLVLAGLEGALLLARVRGGRAGFRGVAGALIDGLRAGGPAGIE